MKVDYIGARDRAVGVRVLLTSHADAGNTRFDSGFVDVERVLPSNAPATRPGGVPDAGLASDPPTTIVTSIDVFN